MDQDTRWLRKPESSREPDDCPKCGTARVWAEAESKHGGHEVVIRRYARLGRWARDLTGASDCRALVCPWCGFTELYITKPEQFQG